MGILLSLLLRFSKFFIVGFLVITYLSGYITVFNFVSQIYNSGNPIKLVTIGLVVVYLFYHITLFLFQKIYIERNIFGAIIYASLINGFILLLIGFTGYKIYNLQVLPFDIAIDKYLPALNFNFSAQEYSTLMSEMNDKETLNIKKALLTGWAALGIFLFSIFVQVMFLIKKYMS